ncbi:MAG: ATP-binding protein [Saprospiraceae bacterium]|nr:ATP-binding protein [Saprospiraceae bacterium]
MKIIMIIGLPGTGKTTFAESLAKSLGAVHLNTDIIRDTMGKRGQYDLTTKTSIYEELLKLTEEHLQNKRSVAVDGTFYQKKLRIPFDELAKKYQIPIFWMEIRANEDIIRTRVNKRRAYSEADFEVYLKIKSQYEPLEAPNLELWSDQLELSDMVEQAKNYVNSTA